MMPQQLWDTTMNPETRTLKRVEIEDAAKAEELFTILMGDPGLARIYRNPRITFKSYRFGHLNSNLGLC
jgi:DNA gyrase/topoisomerase IV subunit B